MAKLCCQTFSVVLISGKILTFPGQVPGGSRAGPGQVPCGSWSSSRQVLVKSRTSSGRVLVKSWVGPGQVSGRSQSSPEQVLGWSWSSPGQVPVKSRVSLGKVHQFENEMLKIRNWFTVFKIVNHFPKIKEEFSVIGKMFSVDYYFSSK